MRPRLDPAAPRLPVSRLVPVVAYAVAMGWLEGVVVVYLRGLLGIGRGEGMPTSAEIMRRVASLPWLLGTEQTRELATLVMLATVAWLAAPRWLPRLGAFLVAFGVWDIAYYVTLRLLLGWPAGPGTMDLLFLIPPHPWWYQPVWIPVAISCAMIAYGVRLFTNRAPGLT